MESEELQESVVKYLMTKHEFSVEEAEEAVAESVRVQPDLWNENADSEELANLLASDEDDD